MRIYISLPISGHDIGRCRARARRHADAIVKMGHTAVTPFDVCPEPNKRYSHYMGQDIAALLECDAILLLSGWSESRGCQLEWQCAEIYRKTIFHHHNEIPKHIHK